MLRYFTIFCSLLSVTTSAFISNNVNTYRQAGHGRQIHHGIRKSSLVTVKRRGIMFDNGIKHRSSKWSSLADFSTSCVSIMMATDNDSNDGSDDDNNVPKSGRVTRLAVRSYKDDGSNKPSSDNYTTKKDERSEIEVTIDGVIDDYNNYRTKALNSTLDRAISIVTQNIYDDLRGVHGYPGVEIGDLGENILIDGLTHTDMDVGTKCKIGEVMLEITERIEPCGNLCKLSFINNEKLAPKLRIQRCVSFLKVLDEPDGYRGWYAKVIETGNIQTGDVMEILTDDK